MQPLTQDKDIAVTTAFLMQISTYAKSLTEKGVHDVEVIPKGGLVTIVINSPGMPTIVSETRFTKIEMQEAAKELHEHVTSYLPEDASAQGSALLEVTQ